MTGKFDDDEFDRGEEMAAYKGYLRSLMRQLLLLKEAIKAKDFDKANKFIDELIADTKANIED